MSRSRVTDNEITWMDGRSKLRIRTRGEIEVFGEWIGAEVAREPLYDPAGERIRS